MAPRKTPGRRLIDDLDKALPPGITWTQIERTTLASIEVMANRLHALRRRTNALIADPEASPAAIAAMANAVRCLEVSMHGLIKTLDPEMALVQAKSVRHQAAANVRWHGAS